MSSTSTPGPDETKKARRGLLAQIAEARTQAGYSEDDSSLLGAAKLREGEALDVNALANSVMNFGVARAVSQASERLQAASMTKEERIGRAVAEAIETRVSQLEEAEPPVPDFEALADEQLAEEQSDWQYAKEAVAEISAERATEREQALEEAAVAAEAAEVDVWTESWENEE